MLSAMKKQKGSVVMKSDATRGLWQPLWEGGPALSPTTRRKLAEQAISSVGRLEQSPWGGEG